jgi:hypothetical protein
MPTLRIEHMVPTSTDGSERSTATRWTAKGSGVRRYLVSRSVDDPNFVMIDLEFDSLGEAEGLLAKMRRMWGSGEGQKVMRNPRARIVDTVETIEV